MAKRNNNTVDRDCDHCGKPYKADPRNLKRGWGLCCSKSCAAKKRQQGKDPFHGWRAPTRDEFGLLWCNCTQPNLVSNAGGRGMAYCLRCSTPYYH